MKPKPKQPAIRCAFGKLVQAGSLKPNPRNPNAHPARQLELYAKVIAHQGWRRAVVVSKRSGFIVTGHGAVEAARLAGWAVVPVDYQDFASDADETAHMLADNKLAELAELSNEDVKAIIQELQGAGDFDLDLTGFDAGELAGLLLEPDPEQARLTLVERFGVPPFSILDARQGYWQDRKRAWLALGIQSELGRGGGGANHDRQAGDNRGVELLSKSKWGGQR